MLKRKSTIVAILAAALGGVTTTTFAQTDPRFDSYLYLSPQYSEIGRNTAERDRKATEKKAPDMEAAVVAVPVAAKAAPRFGTAVPSKPSSEIYEQSRYAQ